LPLYPKRNPDWLYNLEFSMIIPVFDTRTVLVFLEGESESEPARHFREAPLPLSFSVTAVWQAPEISHSIFFTEMLFKRK